MKKALSLFLAFMLLLGSVSALADAGNFNADGEFPLFKETATISFAVPQVPNVEDWDTNWMTTHYEELCNVDLVFNVYPYEEFITQISLAITSNTELPDVVMPQWSTPSLDLVYQWALAGAIIPLNDLIEEYGYWLPKTFETTGVEYLTYVTSPDGNLYTLPVFNQSLPNEAKGKIWLYRPWMEALNLETPTTADELYEVLKAMKEQDPNGNGEADEIPILAGWYNALMNPFQYVPARNPFFVQDGEVTLYYTTEDWREGMQYIRKLFDEGLIDPMSFTVDNTQANALYMSEPAIVGTLFDTWYPTAGTRDTTDRIWEFDMIRPLPNKDGKSTLTFSPSLAPPNLVITSYCEDPATAYRFLDILYTEEHAISIQFGQKDVDWRYAVEGEISAYEYLGMPASFTTLQSVFGTVQNKDWYSTGPFTRYYGIVGGMVFNPDAATMPNARMDWAREAYPEADIYVPTLVYTEEEAEEVNPILSELSSYFDSTMANFCLNRDGYDMYDDSAWEKFLQEIDRIGWSEIQPTIQAVYDRTYK